MSVYRSSTALVTGASKGLGKVFADAVATRGTNLPPLNKLAWTAKLPARPAILPVGRVITKPSKNSPQFLYRTISRAGGLLLIAVLGCRPQAPLVPTPKTIVTVATPIARDVVDAAFFTGRTDGSEFVEVRARVSGYLTKVLFKPGTRIGKGDPLFEIDDRPYRVSLDQAEADVERAKARLTRTNLDLARREALIKTNAVSKEELDRALGDQAEAAATLKSAVATAERAKLDFSWTKVFAPIGGLVSREQITVGNLVTADQTQLTSILRDDPMYVYFDVDERTVLKVVELIREGKLKNAREGKVPLRMALGTNTDFSLHGFVNFVENRVDPNSSTMRVRGEFANPLQAHGYTQLTAGLFCRVRCDLGPAYPAMLVLERAMQSDQDQKFLFIVNSKNQVERRDVRLGQLENGLRVVASGLNPTDRVIINGAQRVRPGVVVDPRETSMPIPAATSSTLNVDAVMSPSSP